MKLEAVFANVSKRTVIIFAIKFKAEFKKKIYFS